MGVDETMVPMVHYNLNNIFPITITNTELNYLNFVDLMDIHITFKYMQESTK